MNTSTLTAFRDTGPVIRPGRTAIRLGLALALCTAAASTGIRPTVSVPTATPPAASAPSLDGRYVGLPSPAFQGRDGECARLATLPDLVIAGERATMEGGAAMLRGRLHNGVAASLAGAMAGPATLTGRFDGTRFTGELRSWNCTYALALTRRPS